jgi:hypothetical protein
MDQIILGEIKDIAKRFFDQGDQKLYVAIVLDGDQPRFGVSHQRIDAIQGSEQEPQNYVITCLEQLDRMTSLADFDKLEC